MSLGVAHHHSALHDYKRGGGGRAVLDEALADAIGVLTEGGRNRAVGATSMNATSSRSHAVLCIKLLSYPSGGASDVPPGAVTSRALPRSTRPPPPRA